MKRRRVLAAGCVHCAGLASIGAWAQRPAAPPVPETPEPPITDRFVRPDLATDEGGLWALMDRQETRLRRSPFLMRDTALREYLQGIACKLGGSHCADVRVYAVRAPFFNASMAPNGMMQVWSGLLLRVDNEAQLAAVLGHEIGHYMKRHTLDSLRSAKSRSAFGLFLAMFGAAGLLANMVALAAAFGFSRDQERQADTIGLGLMTESGYDPREAAKVWQNLLAEMAATPGGDPAKASPLFATHPPSQERSDTLVRLAATATGGFTGEAEYVEKLGPFQSELLDDELKRGQYGETLILLDRLTKRSPQRPDLLYFRGETRRLRAQDGDLDAAVADLQAAISLGNEPPRTHRALGYIFQKQDRSADAQAAFARYLERAPDAPDAGLIKTYLP